jgi:hypothetical protein
MPATDHQALAHRAANDAASNLGGTPFSLLNASIQSDPLAASSFLELEATDPAQQVSQDQYIG